MPKEYKYLYGPVPSRRLGRSLGVDIVPPKACTIDCIYCQLGKTPKTTNERKNYISAEAVLAELTKKIRDGLDADYITIAGSGEPTLNLQLGKLLDAIKKTTNIPLALVTNGTLFYRQDVRADAAKADVVLPSLDAGDAETFRKINRPHADISIEKLVSGLAAFRKEFAGQIWLEVFLVAGLNTDTRQIAAIKALIQRIDPDKIHLNTAVRPTAEAGVAKVTTAKLQAIAASLGPRCEIVADFSAQHAPQDKKITSQDVFSMLKRRPCSEADISAGLAIPQEAATQYLADLHEQGLIDSYQENNATFFIAK